MITGVRLNSNSSFYLEKVIFDMAKREGYTGEF